MQKEEDQVIFRDLKGNEWTWGNIKELIEGYKSFKRFLEIFNYYKDKF